MTKTAMGARMLRKWLNQPLRVSDRIKRRLDLVEELFLNDEILEKLNKLIPDYDSATRYEIIDKIYKKVKYNKKRLNKIFFNTILSPEIQILIDKEAITEIKKFLGSHNRPFQRIIISKSGYSRFILRIFPIKLNRGMESCFSSIGIKK